jgi:multiple sugar transport system substrate-binding protein
MPTVYDFQVTAKWAYDGKLEDISSVIDPLRSKFEPRALSTTFLLQQRQQDARLLRLPAEAADHAHPVLEGHAGRRGLQGKRHPQGLEGLLGLLVREGAAGYRRRPASAASASATRWAWTPATRSISFLTFMDAYNVKLVNDSGKLLVDDPAVRQGLINAMTDYTAGLRQGLHAAVVHQLEGPGQQRGLPQQDHGDDAQRDDLDRREVAGRHEQRHADRLSSAPRPRRTTPS